MKVPEQVLAWLILHCLNHAYGPRPCNPDECAPCAALEWFAVTEPAETSALLYRYAGANWHFQTAVGTVDFRRLQAGFSQARARDALAAVRTEGEADGPAVDLP